MEGKIKWGWMGLFIAILVAISPIFSIITIINSWSEAISYDLFNLYPKFYTVTIIDISISLILIFFSIYAGLSLYLLKDKAVYKAKMFLIVYLIYGISVPLLLYFVDFPEEAISTISGEIGSGIFRSFIFFAVWFWFLSSSKTVNRIYFQDEEPERICPNCGRVIPSDANACPYCNKKFEEFVEKGIMPQIQADENQQVNTNLQTDKQIKKMNTNMKLVLIILTCAACITLALAAGALLGAF